MTMPQILFILFTLTNLQTTLAERGDLRYMFPAQVTLQP